jgi:ribose-phosphate pyrophosphokinase
MHHERTTASSEMLVFGGSGSPLLTQKICRYLGIDPGLNETFKFAEGNTFVRILQNVRGRDTYIIQSTVFPSNDNFMELLFYVDALKRASADSVTAVIPFFSYAKGDKKDEPRVSIRAKVCADALVAAGVDRVVTVDLHAPQIQGFFSVPVDNLYALPIVGNRIKQEGLDDIVIVSADVGFAKEARNMSSYLGTAVAIADKQRVAHDDSAEVLGVLGDVRDKTAIIVDDFAISCRTLADAAVELLNKGARQVYAAVTHAVFAPGAMEIVEASPIAKVFVTDTIETQPEEFCKKVETISIAPLLGEAISRIHNSESISAMFEWERPKPRPSRSMASGEGM